MPTEQKMLFCSKCSRPTMQLAPRVNNILHFLISVFTLGLWVLVWLLLSADRGNPVCTVCGTENKERNDAKGCLFGLIVLIALSVWVFIKNWPTDEEMGWGNKSEAPAQNNPVFIYETNPPPPLVHFEKKPAESPNVIHSASGEGWKVKVEYE